MAKGIPSLTLIRDSLAETISTQIRQLQESGVLPQGTVRHPEIQDTKSAEHGDFATNVAMVSAKGLGVNPREMGEKIAAALLNLPQFRQVEVAGPGFINMFVDQAWLAGHMVLVLQAGTEFGRTETAAPQRINVEFVSVNPNGPITIGSGRGAAYGSTLCNVLAAAGNTVHREYYINDGVNSEQMRLFAESVRCLLLGNAVPENGYKGDYVMEVAETVRRMFSQGFHPLIAYSEKVLSEGPHPVLARHLESHRRLQNLIETHGTEGAISHADLGDLKLLAETLMTEAQSAALSAFGVKFDTWFSEQTLHDSGQVQSEIDTLEKAQVADTQSYRTQLKLAKGGKIEEVLQEQQAKDEDDADGVEPTLWLRSTKFGDDMDRVLRRRDGRLTYISSDVAYHWDKFNRPPNADKLITILGPDHHGYIGRLHAVVAALLVAEGMVKAESTGEPLGDIDAKLYSTPEERDTCHAALKLAREKLEVQIYQLVRFMKDGKPAPMRKRDGNIYALIDLMKEIGEAAKPNGTEEEKLEVGKDVARFFYLMRSHDTTFDFDLDLAARQSDENPVFYVQYAHARICSVISKAKESGFQADSISEDLASRLTHPAELALIKKICDLPWEVQRCAQDYGVHRLATYAIELARTYHAFYDQCRVIQPEQPELTHARLALCEGVKIALRSVFGLLGISAPERMESRAS
ncbi:MAG: arginine--tRNA ligase [Armatimonadetes bacterium]|nr:arginine--tRNA ligase [Armatimonadota bacterium]